MLMEKPQRTEKDQRSDEEDNNVDIVASMEYMCTYPSIY